MVLAKKVLANGSHRDAFKNKCIQAQKCHPDLKLQILELIKAITTRWNSHAKCLLRHLLQQLAITSLTTDRTLPFTKYMMSMTEWEILEQIEEILKVLVLISVTIF
jgi:uncharacterized phage-like protein YoqJ